MQDNSKNTDAMKKARKKYDSNVKKITVLFKKNEIPDYENLVIYADHIGEPVSTTAKKLVIEKLKDKGYF